MPLSTSSFERALPDMPWLRIFGAALLICFTFIALMEIRLAQLGYHSTVLDSKERWAKERTRASQLGEKALILIGGSRIQLGIDLDTLRKETGLEPVQLAVDGSSFVPILKGLADDPSIRGTVLVDYSPSSVEGALSEEFGPSTAFEQAFEKHAGQYELFSLARVEKSLTEIIREHLRCFADGSNPLMSLQYRIIPGKNASQYLITLPDRSRLADYSLVSMPAFYYFRVARNMGEEKSTNFADPDIENILKRKIRLLRPHDNSSFVQGARYLARLATQIKTRNGKVYFVEMPSSGMVRQEDEMRYPEEDFLGVFEKEVGMPVLSSAVAPSLRSFTCPDGSHLDFRDRTRFTTALTHSLAINR